MFDRSIRYERTVQARKWQRLEHIAAVHLSLAPSSVAAMHCRASQRESVRLPQPARPVCRAPHRQCSVNRVVVALSPPLPPQTQQDGNLGVLSRTTSGHSASVPAPAVEAFGVLTSSRPVPLISSSLLPADGPGAYRADRRVPHSALHSSTSDQFHACSSPSLASLCLLLSLCLRFVLAVGSVRHRFLPRSLRLHSLSRLVAAAAQAVEGEVRRGSTGAAMAAKRCAVAVLTVLCAISAGWWRSAQKR